MRVQRNPHDLVEMRWLPMVVISILLHLAILAIVLFVPKSIPARPVEGIVYEVNLVELPGAGKRKVQGTKAVADRKGKAIVKKQTKAKRITSPKKKEKPIAIGKRQAKKKTSPVKKPETSASRLIDEAISRIERKVKSKGKTDHLDRAIAKLETKVKGGPGATAGGSVDGLPIRIYKMEVETWIKSNWSYPVALRGQEDLEAVVVLMVKRDGSIVKTDIKRRSSNAIFDQSVIKAVERSDPLPPFPEGYTKSHEEIEISFNLEDLKER